VEAFKPLTRVFDGIIVNATNVSTAYVAEGFEVGLRLTWEACRTHGARVLRIPAEARGARHLGAIRFRAARDRRLENRRSRGVMGIVARV
jgi:hypothetical protein